MRRAKIEEVQLTGGGFYWDNLACLLGATYAEVVAHVRGGKSSAEVYLPVEDIPAEMGDDHLLVNTSFHTLLLDMAWCLPAVLSIHGEADWCTEFLSSMYESLTYFLNDGLFS